MPSLLDTVRDLERLRQIASVLAAQRAGVSGELMAKRAVEIIIQQIFEDGFFHVDALYAFAHTARVWLLGNPEP